MKEENNIQKDEFGVFIALQAFIVCVMTVCFTSYRSVFLYMGVTIKKNKKLKIFLFVLPTMINKVTV